MLEYDTALNKNEPIYMSMIWIPTWQSLKRKLRICDTWHLLMDIIYIFSRKVATIQYNRVQSIQRNAIQYKTIQYNVCIYIYMWQGPLGMI